MLYSDNFMRNIDTAKLLHITVNHLLNYIPSSTDMKGLRVETNYLLCTCYSNNANNFFTNPVLMQFAMVCLPSCEFSNGYKSPL